MKEFIIQSKNIVIRDREILRNIKDNKIEYLHFYTHKEGGGSLSIIAKEPPKSDMTVSKWYHKISVRDDYALVQNPKFMKRYIGKNICYYIERLFPEDDEVFRIQAVNFVIETARQKEKRTSIKQVPYFTKSGEFIVPQYYLNQKLNHKFVRMKVSTNRTTPVVLNENLLLIFLIKATQASLGCGKNLYGFRAFPNGIRTKRLKFFTDHLHNHGKDLGNYKYTTTIPYQNCPYGIMVFEEKK